MARRTPIGRAAGLGQVDLGSTGRGRSAMNGYLLKVADDPAFVAKARGRGERLAAATAGKARGRGEVPVLAPAPRACARQAGRSIYC